MSEYTSTLVHKSFTCVFYIPQTRIVHEYLFDELILK